ncbi:hypothetical protein [Streptomyces coriariae]|uniref:hypothetical protein n=1 Tax=Streptomyces coriariae TaxID=2864460 RepID=UPI001E412ECF|nr:hypothetical protein [Streptomyces coriariae]
MAVKNRWLALSGVTISVLVIGFDTTILNAALPASVADTSAFTGELQWIVGPCAVVVAAAMLSACFLADRFGRSELLTMPFAQALDEAAQERPVSGELSGVADGARQ